MGVNNLVFDLLATHCKRDRPGSALIAGYPDMLVSDELLEQHLGTADFPIDPAAEEIVRIHGDQGYTSPRAPAPVFEALGYSPITVVDIERTRGVEVIVDLNEPRDLRSLGLSNDELEFVRFPFDLVLDHGTIEHCFNIAQAAKNLAAAVALDGFIVQHLPLNCFNHGFYNLNPMWFECFYESNHFEILHLEAWALSRNITFDVPRQTAFVGAPEFSLLTMVARRREVKPITYPMQRQYR